MLVTNFRLKYALYKVVLAGYQLFDTGRLHPVRERSIRALNRSVDYIEQRMPDAIGFDTQKEVLTYALAETAVAGHYLEFGVFTGGTIRYLAKELEKAGRRDVLIHGFDSFEGLPEAWSGFSLGRLAFSVNGKLPRVPNSVRLHKGWFSSTIPAWQEQMSGPVAFMHIDCDLYSSTVDVLEGLRERLQPGTVIVFDEYFNYPNWERHEFRAWQEFVSRHGVTYEYLAFARQQVAVRILKVGLPE
jgi:predicted O-methyltransferase YrrM